MSSSASKLGKKKAKPAIIEVRIVADGLRMA